MSEFIWNVEKKEYLDGIEKLPIDDGSSKNITTDINDLSNFVKAKIGSAYGDNVTIETNTTTGKLQIKNGGINKDKVASTAGLRDGQLITASNTAKGGIKIGENFSVNDDEKLEFSESFMLYIQSLVNRIAALEAIVQPHTISIDCKSEVSAGGEVLSVVVNNNFEATNITLDCRIGSEVLIPEGSGKNWALNIPIATTARQIILTATASKGSETPVIATKIITQPKAAIAINCSKTAVNALGETITVDLMNNFGAATSAYELTSITEGVSISSIGGGSFSVTIGANTGSSTRYIQLTALATKGGVTIQAGTQITQQARILTFDCWIGHGESVEEVINDDGFKITGNISMTSLRGNHYVEYAPEDDGDRIFIVVPKSFNIDIDSIIYENAFPLAADMGNDITIQSITYSVVISNRLIADTHKLTFNQ